MDRRSFVSRHRRVTAALATRKAGRARAYPDARHHNRSARFRRAASATPSRVRSTLRLRPIFKQPVVLENKAGAAGAVGAQYRRQPPSPTATRCSRHIVSISGFAAVDKLFGRPPKIHQCRFHPDCARHRRPDRADRQQGHAVQDAEGFRRPTPKANPDKVIYSSSGLYGASHIPMALFAKAAGELKMRHLPTNGGGPAITAVLGGNVRLLSCRRPRSRCRTSRRQGARARRFERQARQGAARRADVQGAGLRPRILFLGRHVRAKRHAGADHRYAA